MPLSHTSTYAELTDMQLQLLGRIAAEWANVEYLLSVLLSRLLLTPEFLARTYTSSMSAHRLSLAIREALEIHQRRYKGKVVDPVATARIENVMSTVDRMRIARNKVSHFCWTRQTDDRVFGTSFGGGVPTPKREKRDAVILTNVELEQIASECHDLVEALLETTRLLPEVEEEDALRLVLKGSA